MAGNFKIPRHNDILELIREHLDTEQLERNNFYFGGGTLCSMRYGEYRESVDVDFLSSDRNGVAALKFASCKLTDLPQIREPKIDKDGIRLWCEFKGKPFKAEMIYESRITLDSPVYFHDLLSLNSVDLMACKLLANSDRSYNTLAVRKDLIDMLAIYHHEPTVLDPAWKKAYDAYGSWLVRCTKISLSEDNFNETLNALGIIKNHDKYYSRLRDFAKEIEMLTDAGERGNIVTE